MLFIRLMPMIIRRLHKLPFLCLLALCLLTNPAGTFGYVWCVSADGHAALEVATAGNCGLDNPVPTTDANPSVSLTIETDDCGPCLDVSPSHQWGSPRSRQDQAPVSFPTEFPLLVVGMPTPPPARFLNQHRVVNLSPRTPDPILHHRTTVLLI